MVVIRNFGSDDLAAYVHLVSEIDEAAGLGSAASVARIEEHLGRPGHHPREDLFLAELHGRLMGYADLVREAEIGRVVAYGGVHPAHRGQGVGSSLLEVAIEHSRKLGAKAIQIPVSQRTQAGGHFVVRKGFRAARRHWEMRLTQYVGGTLQIPQGFELRHFVPGDEEQLCALQNRAFTGSWGFRPNTVEEIRYLMNMSLCRPEGVLLVAEGESLVGYCWTIDDPSDEERGFIRMMGVDPAYHGRGLGRAMLVAGLDYLQRRGIRVTELTVDSKNHVAKSLYQSLGFKKESTTVWYEKRLARR